MGLADSADATRYGLVRAQKLAMDFEGKLWGYFPLDTTNMQWAAFDGVLLKFPFSGIWTRSRSDAPESFAIGINDALALCRALEPVQLRREIVRLRELLDSHGIDPAA